MKYVLMFTSRPDLDAEIDPEVMKADYQRIYAWFEENAASIADGGAELLGVETATSVKHGDDGPVVVDGPFNEAKEVVGGFSIIDVPDMDAAIALTKSWPSLKFPGVGRRDPADGRGLLPVRVTSTSTDGLLARTLREEAGPLVARLSRRFGDFDLAEEAVQSAVVEALTTWRRDGPPRNPAAWLQVAAQRNALDGVRRGSRQRALATRAQPAVRRAVRHRRPARPAVRVLPPGPGAGGQAGAHPARGGGPHHPADRPRVPRQREHAGAADRPGQAQDRRGRDRAHRAARRTSSPERLADVLAVVYVMFNEGFVSSTGATQDRDLAADAVWLAGVVATAVPQEAEAWGLAALLTIQHARSGARFDEHGGLVLLRDQDRSRWDAAAIAAGERLLDRAGALRRPGRYQLQAAIAAVHATAASWEETDWLQIAMLYDALARHDPSPVVRLNQAVAHAQVD